MYRTGFAEERLLVHRWNLLNRLFWLWKWRLGESVAQSKSTRSRKPELYTSSVVIKWMGGRYVLGFATSLRFFRSQILCRLYKRPSDETKPRPPPPPMYTQKISHMHVKYPVHHVRVRWIMATPKQVITRHALKVKLSVHNAEVGHYVTIRKSRRSLKFVKLIFT